MRKICVLLVVLAITGLSFINPLAAQQTSRVIEDGGTGPFHALMVSDASLPTHTIFRPEDLSPFAGKEKLPIIAWGNGGCANSSSGHLNFLSEVASQGFLVIAIGPMPEPRQAPAPGQGGPMGQGGGRPMGQAGQGGGARPMPQGGQPAAAAADQPKTSQLIDAINWAIAQNADKNSPYYNKIDVSKIAVAGMSCGGLQAMEAAPDPRVSTVMICNSGIINSGGGSMGGMPALTKEHLKKVHTPIIYLLGGESDIAYANGMDDFKQINHVPAFVANMNVGHGGTYMQPHGGEFAKVASAWVLWQLKGDKEAAKMFVGNPAGLSTNPNWKVDKKNIP
jgi:dienelactone hydrolase